MKDQTSWTKTFGVIHPIFYKEFDVWLKEKGKEQCPKEGIYILCADKPIQRILGTDESGILYIGKGEILSSRTRIGKLINSINDKEQKHEAGNRYNEALYVRKFPLESLSLKIELVKNPRNVEKNKLTEYYQKFGELPPLNRNS